MGISTETELKKKDCMRVMDSLAAVATKQVKSAGKVTIPGLCMIKTRVKPATKAGKREMFGKMVVVKAKREDHCEGLLRCRPEEEHLSLSSSLGALSLCWLACCAEWESRWRGTT